jgi:type IV pilus assembly protein PilV
MSMNVLTPQRGSSLIEVLISLVLVAVTMLGLLGLQLRSMGLQKDSLDRRNAAILISNFADRLTGNFEGFTGGDYDARTLGISGAPPATTTPCGGASCNNSEIALRDWEQFQLDVRNRLPGGVAGLALVNNAAILVTVGWLDPQRDQELAALRGTAVDANSDDTDDACAAIGVASTRYRCFTANVYP